LAWRDRFVTLRNKRKALKILVLKFSDMRGYGAMNVIPGMALMRATSTS
jgi:hypothetical protein